MAIYYTNLVDMSDPMKFGYMFSILNQEMTTKYFKITGVTDDGGWTPQVTQALGAIGAGNQSFFDIKDFMHRTVPVSPVTDDVIIRIQRYGDASYTNLEETADKLVQHKFIDSGSMTLFNLDDFDDGTVQGWVHTQGGSSYVAGTLGIDGTYFISSPYSLKMHVRADRLSSWETVWGNASKSFDVPDVSEVYLSFEMMIRKIGNPIPYMTRIYNNGDIIAELNPTDNHVLFDKWMRMVIPLKPNTTNVIDIYHSVRSRRVEWIDLFFDDMKIVYL